LASRLKSIVKLLLRGPFISVHKSYCNPYSKCSFNNGLWIWAWISSSSYESVGIGVLHGVFINAQSNDVYRGYMVYSLDDTDGYLRFYLGPLILKNVPLAIRVYGNTRRLFSFNCKCGDIFEGNEEELRKHLLDKHAGLEKPSKLEIDAYLQLFAKQSTP
jgi:hypothetical protein